MESPLQIVLLFFTHLKVLELLDWLCFRSGFQRRISCIDEYFKQLQ